MGRIINRLDPSDEMARLRSACEDALPRLYDKEADPAPCEKLQHELALIAEWGVARDFLAVAEVAQDIRALGVLVGPGRGSSASSLVCYLLGITVIDPIEHGLLFERILPPPGELLDIDINIPLERLDDVAEALTGAPAAYPYNLTVTRGVTKVDLCGLPALDRVERALGVIGSPALANPWALPLDDADTYKLLALAPADREIHGFLTVSSCATTLRELQTRDFADLAAVVALNRPGTYEVLERYVESCRGGAYVSDIPEVADLLHDSRGLLIYQEQVLRIAVELAGLDAATANSLRKAIGRSNTARLDEVRPHFIGGAMERGLGDEAAERTWSFLLTHGGNSFCKSHAVAVALIGYVEAYLEAHYPEARATALG